MAMDPTEVGDRKRAFVLALVAALTGAAVAASMLSQEYEILLNGWLAQGLRAMVSYLAANPTVAAACVAGLAAVFVGSLTLWGVKLSLDAAAKRSARELAHSASQSLRDREHIMDQAERERSHAAYQAHIARIAAARREVYLEAAQELIGMLQFLSRLPKLDIVTLDFAQITKGLSVAVSKIALLADLGTVLKTRALHSDIQATAMKLLPLVVPVRLAVQEVAIHEQSYQGTQTEIARLLAAMSHHNSVLDSPPAAFDALMRSFEGQQGEAKKYAQQRMEAQRTVATLERAFLMQSMEVTKDLTLQADELAHCMRIELGLSTDLNALQAQTLALFESAKAKGVELLRTIDVQVEQLHRSLEEE